MSAEEEPDTDSVEYQHWIQAEAVMIWLVSFDW